MFGGKMRYIISKLTVFVLSASFLLYGGLTANAKELLIGGAACETGMQAPLDTPGINGAKVDKYAPMLA